MQEGTRKGKFIVIDGPDATGKATQTRFLAERMRAEGFRVKPLSFPQYQNLSSAAVWLYLQRREGKPFSFAELEGIERAFEGNVERIRERLWQIIAQITPSPWGDSSKLDPYTASLFYAIDRAAARESIREDLESGAHCVSDRYVSANLIHQGSKIADSEELYRYLTRMMELEHEWLKIPKPDANLLLHLPPAIRKKFQDEKFRQLTVFREADVHERDAAHQSAAHRMCETLAELFPDDFQIVECAEGGRALSPEAVHEKIWAIVKPILTQ